MSEELNIECKVQWKPLWRFLSIFFLVVFWIGIPPIMIIRWVKLGKEKAFEHISLIEFLALMGILSVAAIVFGFLFASVIRIAKIQIKEGYLHGRNYWCLKNRIPLNEITDLTRFSSNGIEAIVAHSKRNGKVYIPLNIENFEEIIALLATHVPEDISSQDSQHLGSA